MPLLRLTLEREARGWSRAELSRRSQMSAGDVGKIESGRARAYDSQLRKLAEALGVPMERRAELLRECSRPKSAAAGEAKLAR